jgi:hypothetical protein
LFFDLRGCPGQLARTMTNPTTHWTPCKPSGHVRHRGDDRRAHEDSNPGAAGGDKPLPPPGQDPRCMLMLSYFAALWGVDFLRRWISDKSLGLKNLFFYDFRFEPCDYSSDGHWKLIWSLTLGPVKLVEIHISWLGYPC